MKLLSPIFILLAITCFAAEIKAQANFTQLSNYQVYYGRATRFGQDWITLRRFEDHNRYHLLLVNPQTLETRTDLAESYQLTPLTLPQLRNIFKNSPYQKALSKAEQQSVALQDAGIENRHPQRNRH